MKKGQAKNRGIFVVIGIIFFVVIFGVFRPSVGPEDPDWEESYKEAATMAGIDEQNFDHNSVINSNEELEAVANLISSESINAKDAVRKTMEWVFQNVDYTRKTSALECYAETSIDAFEIGQGDCVTMTKLAVSLLRSQGIAARPAGGCISSNFACGVLFAIHPERAPRFEPVDLEDPKKRGGLHEWLEVWLPDEGWLIGEATSGQLFSKNCRSYDYHDYNTDSTGMCVILDQNYVRQCARY